MKQEKFLLQSYKDAWSDYEFSVKNLKSPHWDWIIITSSNEIQANAYRIQLEIRKVQERMPKGTKFAVISDPDGERVGSGGATLNALKFIINEVGASEACKQKILIIHSGGDSKRIPQYSACGKLFSTVPRILPNGKKSTIFDELIISVSGVPGRVSNGILTMPGDTEILFNPIQLDLMSCEAAGLSIKTSISEGTSHGVFVNGDNNIISNFLHKQSEETLKSYGAVDENSNVDIDTGCIWFGEKVTKALLSLICDNNEKYNDERFRKFVNSKCCLSFYGDFVYPLSSESTLEEFLKESPEGSFTPELEECRKEIFYLLHDFSIKLIRMTPAKYIHIGTTQELFNLMVWGINKYNYLGWSKKTLSNAYENKEFAVSNSYISNDAEISSLSYIEDSIIGSKTIIKDNVIVSGVILDEITIPENIVLHCIKLNNKRFVCRIYGIEDNPKESSDGKFLGTTLRKIINYARLNNNQVWDASYPSIWNAKLYAECESVKEAVNMAMILYKISKFSACQYEIEKWKDAKKLSLNESFNKADTLAILKYQDKIEHIVRVNRCIDKITKNYEVEDCISELRYSNGSSKELESIMEKAQESNFPINMRLYLLLSKICRDSNFKINLIDADTFEDKAYEIIKNEIVESVNAKHKFNWSVGQFNKEKEEVSLPVRVNFCGSPSDAAPYCLEHGGTMLDGALLLKNKYPIHVEVKRLPRCEIEFESFDLKSKKVYTNINEVRNCSNLFDTFSLHKAVLAACGIIPLDTRNVTLEEICDKLGGGIYMSTSVDVPKGSGLGTSSIVAAACIKALNSIFNQDVSDECIYAQVFLAEQLMTTGGGWQDQVGGLTSGLKLIRSNPGVYQNITVEKVNLNKEIRDELQERFVLIFSGQRRLARNVLREEMNQCIKNNKKSLEAIEKIQKLCVLMKFELERGNITSFAKYISEQFELVKILDKGASNTCIEYIFDVCDDLICGKSICGAGGGGFLQVILKEGVTKNDLRKRINDVFCNCGIEVWDSTLI